jgi:hypothetical protein
VRFEVLIIKNSFKRSVVLSFLSIISTFIFLNQPGASIAIFRSPKAQSMLHRAFGSCADVLIYSPWRYKYLSHRAGMPGMEYAGSQDLSRVIAYYKKNIPHDGSILEIGPYYTPLGIEPSIEAKNHYVAWDLDFHALESIWKSKSRLIDANRNFRLIQVNLNRLSQSDYKHLLTDSFEADGKKSFSAVVVSSVFNYVDFRVVLKRTLPEVQVGGYLFVANSSLTAGARHKNALYKIGGAGFKEFMGQEFSNFEIVNYLDLESTYYYELGEKFKTIPSEGKFIAVYKRVRF